MNATKVSARLGNVVEMPFAPTRQAAIPVDANLVTLVIPMSIVMTLMSVETIYQFVEEKPNAKMFLHLLNAHVLMGRPLTPLRKDVGVLWHARLIISALVMPSAMADLAHVLNPMLAPIARTLVTRLLVFPMLSVLFKLASLCVDACPDSNCYPSKELVLILTNANHHLVDLEPFVKTQLDPLTANVQLEQLETHP
jgi:hypothetical protein